LGETLNINSKIVKHNLEPLILSLLNTKPLYGYALIKAIRSKHGANVGASTMYPELIRLQQEKSTL
jgi:DNA-binding PadR family transcriptional regulator